MEPNNTPNDNRSLRWLARYGAVEEHVIERGTIPRESRTVVNADELKLAEWLRYQRRRAAEGRLPAWQRARLEQLQGFNWDERADRWQVNLTLLSEFLERERRIPRYRTDDEVEQSLAAWVHKQRHLAARGELAQHRVAALRRLDFRIV